MDRRGSGQQRRTFAGAGTAIGTILAATIVTSGFRALAQDSGLEAPIAKGAPLTFNKHVKTAKAITEAARTRFSVPIAANNTSAIAGPTATGTNALAVGYGASAPGDTSLAFGTFAGAFGDFSAALGGVAAGTRSVAVGLNGQAFGANSVAVGYNAQAGGGFSEPFANADTTAIGEGAQAGTTAAGQTNATAVGQGATANVANGTALGQGAVVGNVGAVALGQGSTTAAPNPTGGATLNGLTFGRFAGANPTSIVSIGSFGAERQITNVAAGQITATSTDAVNGSELYGVAAQVANLASRTASVFVSANTAGAPTPIASGTNSSAGGFGAVASGMSSTAVGNRAAATDTGSTAVGQGALANVADGTALGQGAVVSDVGAVALGQSSTTAAANPTGGATLNGMTFSGFAGANPTSVVSVGSVGAERQITNVAAGRITAASTDAVNGSQLYSVASAVSGIENGGGTKYFHANSSGADSKAIGHNSVAVGPNAVSNGVGSIALGSRATTTGNGSIAIGQGAVVSNVGAVALGQGSTTAAAHPTGGATLNGVTFSGFAGANPTSVVSVGSVGAERQITNVAAGRVTATSTDAVNGSQLYSVASTVSGLENGIENGGGIKYFHSNSSGADATAAGHNSVAVGPNAVSNGAGSIALGSRATTTSDGSIAIGQSATAANGGTAVGTGAVATGDPTASFGNGAMATGNNSSAFGAGATATATNSTAIGQGASATVANSVAIGQGSTTSAAHSIATNTALGVTNNAGTTTGVFSVGAAGAARQLQNVAAGAVTATSTDVVNGSQLYSVATNTNTLGATTAAAIGGSATYAPATGITGPSYTLNGSNVTYSNVVSGQQAIADGGAGPVQYSTPGTPSNALNLVGSGGAVTLGNVAGGTVAAGSAQAINGNQLYGTAGSVASALGGGSGVTTNGTVSAPAYQVGGSTYNNVGSAVAALNTSVQTGLGALQGEVNQNYQRTNAGIAGAIAGTGLRYDDRPGKLSTAASIAGFHGEVGFAGGIGMTSDDARWRINAAVTVSPSTAGGTDVGGVGGLSYTLN